jgi:hypothetical protein
MAILINDNTARVQYTATSGQTVFTVPFEFFANEDLKVYNGSTLLTYSTSPANGLQYSVTGAGVTGGGSITLGTGGAAAGNIITISRDIAVQRTTDFPTAGPFNINALNSELDRITAVQQNLETELENRVLRLSDSDTPTTLNALPSAANRALKLLSFDSAGNPVASAPVDGSASSLATSLSSTAGAGSIGYGSNVVYAGGTVGNELVPRVTIALLAGVSPVVGKVAFVQDTGREGHFICRAGTAPTDTQQGIYVASSTANFYWERVWDGVYCPPEWFGAQINNPSFDNYNAFMGALNVTGILSLGKGVYYSSSGFVLPEYCVVKGQGALHTAIVVNHATDHLMSQDGTYPGTYAGGANLQGFGITRGVAATVPASASDDRTQGHGLHFAMVSNPIVKDVYTYNNLVEVYVSNVLSIDFHVIRGINLTGASMARWYGLWVDGFSPIGSFGGPSPNPSARISKVNMVGGGATQAYGYYLENAIQDLWINELESAGCTKGIFVDCNNATCGDVHLNAAVMDGYRTNGIHILNVPPGSSLFMSNPWVAGTVGATGAGIRIENSHNINIVGATSDGALANSVYMFHLSDSSNVEATLTANNYVSPCYMISAFSCNINVKAYKNISGGGNTGDIILAIGGNYTSLTAAGNAVDQKWLAGISVDATVTTYKMDVTGVDPASVTDRMRQAGIAVTTQGNVSGNIIFNPGAGAML